MIYKVGVLGASGRTGLEVANLLAEGYEVAGQRFELGDAIAKQGKLTSIDAVPVRKITDPDWQPVHVWIDFSRPEATVELLSRLDTPIVIATTGFSDGQRLFIEQYSRRHPVLLASNTSLGISLIGQWLGEVPGAEIWQPDVVLEETHHRRKVDAPSGTAKTLLQILESRGFKDVQVHATRAGNEKGLHTVRFISDDEEIEIRHRVSDRKVFAKGALVGAQFLLKKKTPGLYAMADVWKESP